MYYTYQCWFNNKKGKLRREILTSNVKFNKFDQVCALHGMNKVMEIEKEVNHKKYPKMILGTPCFYKKATKDGFIKTINVAFHNNLNKIYTYLAGDHIKVDDYIIHDQNVGRVVDCDNEYDLKLRPIDGFVKVISANDKKDISS